ncbi:retinal guanylyl cyclase 2-like [Branchiostoma floridae x Branchiostoma japonicum]
MATAINNTMPAHRGVDGLTNGTAITARMREVEFEGMSGRVTFDRKGERMFDFALLQHPVDGKSPETLILLAASYPDGGTLQYQGVQQDGVAQTVLLPAPDPACKFEGFCENPSGNDSIVVVGVLVGVFLTVVVCVVSAVLFSKVYVKSQMRDSKLLLVVGDLVFVNSTKTSRIDLHGQGLRHSLAISSAQRSQPGCSEYGDITSPIARYKGELVWLKRMPLRDLAANSKVMKVLKQMRDLHNENVNPFMGCYTEPGNQGIVNEHCSRGSLEDLIRNEEMQLDWVVKQSLLTDLVRGMKYLHSSPIQVHGRLNSRNCLIDGRFVLKISDYGLPDILATQKESRKEHKEETERSAKELLWTAPELLRDPVLRKAGTQKGDVYSFAIICQEIILRGPPFCMLSLSAEEIIAKVKKPPPLCRPSVTISSAPQDFINMMKQCWTESPDMRTDFNQLYEELKIINKGNKINIVDNMFKMLEQYSSNLEDMILERTKALDEEKKKTEELLSQMLPSSVADNLKRGLPVKPEAFSETTIYFSDIVGFTTISAMSEPMQVVDLLNDLYTTFDDVIRNYDVYKVETIGDAYMVVSGLPVRNGNKHAGEIATMSLDILHASGKFTIRHMPDVPLRIRIGLHSGPVVAGVVGITMPRYCLFGDTVNTASRMESTGMPFRIHMSQTTMSILHQLGEYKFEPRGKVLLKGKGHMTSYWLTGKDNYDKELPDPGVDNQIFRRLTAWLDGRREETNT